MGRQVGHPRNCRCVRCQPRVIETDPPYVPRHPIGVRRARPRLCATCHIPAQFALVETRPAARIDLDACVTRFTIDRATYYCPEHIAAAERTGEGSR